MALSVSSQQEITTKSLFGVDLQTHGAGQDGSVPLREPLEPFNSSNDVTVTCDVTKTVDVTSPFFCRFIVSALQHKQ